MLGIFSAWREVIGSAGTLLCNMTFFYFLMLNIHFNWYLSLRSFSDVSRNRNVTSVVLFDFLHRHWLRSVTRPLAWRQNIKTRHSVLIPFNREGGIKVQHTHIEQRYFWQWGYLWIPWRGRIGGFFFCLNENNKVSVGFWEILAWWWR